MQRPDEEKRRTIMRVARDTSGQMTDLGQADAPAESIMQIRITQIAQHYVIGLMRVFAHGAEFAARIVGDEADAAGVVLDQELRGGDGGLKDFVNGGVDAEGLQFAG